MCRHSKLEQDHGGAERPPVLMSARLSGAETLTATVSLTGPPPNRGQIDTGFRPSGWERRICMSCSLLAARVVATSERCRSRMHAAVSESRWREIEDGG